MSDEEEHQLTHSFFGVYILYNRNPKYKGSVYIGFTVNPERRIRQHNREIKGGAWKTGRKCGPWDMVLITHGFSTKLAALQFEWAWQNHQKSRRLSHLLKKQPKETIFSYRLRILSEMLNTGPWNRLCLTIQWLKQEYHEHFPIKRPPPTHMPIAYGEIKSAKKRIASMECRGSQESITSEEELLCCRVCFEVDKKDLHNPLLHCIVDSCDFVAHTICFSTLFLKQTMGQGKYLIPISGQCSSCEQEIFWADVIKQKRYSLDDVEFCDSQEEDIHGTQIGLSDDEEFQ